MLILNAFSIGAVNGIRTRDPQLGKLMLYQLSYYRLSSMFRAKLMLFFYSGNF